MINRRSVLIKIGLTLIFIFILIIHLFSIWKVKLDAIALILILLALIPWFLKYIESLDIPGLGKLNISKIDQASFYIKDLKVRNDETEIKISDTFNKDFPIEQNIKYLSFKARINYVNEAGAQFLIQIRINDLILNTNHILNRGISRKIADGRVQPIFKIENKSWSLPYSPDFVSNYSHIKYKVLNFDPYLFVFNIYWNYL